MIFRRHSFFLFLIAALYFTSCKSTRNIQSTASQDSQVEVDSTVVGLDTIKAASVDTLVVDSVEIGINRLLPEYLEVIGVGDIMLGTNFPEPKYLPADSGKYMLSAVDSVLQSADITFGNLEGVILNEGGNPKNCKNPDKCYIFRSPEYMAANLKNAGFDLLSTANNHSGDFGTPGRKNTKRVLDSLDIHHAGFTETPYTIFKSNQLRIGFAAFSPNKGTPQITDIENAKTTVQYLDSLCDIVIISFHGGAEGKTHTHVTGETEIFYGENRGNVQLFSRSLIDAGADIIFGHGPHVPRAVEVYQNKFIAYSLGNFATYARFNLRGANAYAPIIKVKVSPSGEFVEGKIISAIQRGLGIPIIDPSHRASKMIRALTIEDIPETNISIEDSGVINYIQE